MIVNRSISNMVSIYLLIISLLTLTLTCKPIFTLSFPTFHNNPRFDSEIALFGDAQIAAGGGSSSVQLNRPIASSSGLILHRKPFKFLESNPTGPISFSTDFLFSISPHSGDGLALVIVPTDFPHKFSEKTSFGLPGKTKFLGIEFDTSMDANVGDPNANHVGVDVCSLVSARVSNVSSLKLVLNSGLKLRSWVDYDASSKRLEVRLSGEDKSRPYDPLIAFPIDLSEMWKGEEVFIGISSSSGNSPQTSSVYSWRFRVRSVPKWMHSEPVDPMLSSVKSRDNGKEHKRNPCFLSILSGFMVGAGCGVLVASIVLLLWAIFINKDALISAVFCLHPVDFGYKKVSVDVEKCLGNVKN
ncbi:hypothetical protein U1Q18_026230 [Sarracenia purpurea var. burkii]